MSSTNAVPTDSHFDRRTATERVIAGLWSEVLQTSHSITPEDDFFALGGDSMAMVTLEFRIHEALAVRLPAGSVLGASTLKQLSDLVESLITDPTAV